MPHRSEEILEPIPPGTILKWVPPRKKWSPSKLTREGEVVVRTEIPARIHLSVLDMTRFCPGHPGGGGIGYAIQMHAHSIITIREIFDNGEEPELLIKAKRATLVEHIVRLFLQHLGISGKLEVEGAGHEINHMGLGSTSALLSAVAHALNTALGVPYSKDEVRYLIGCNFVEEWKNGLVIPGFETGVGPFVGIHGGFGIISDRLRPVAHYPLPEEYEVVIALFEEEMSDTLVESPNAGISETELLMNRARALDERDREKKAYEVLMHLIPAGASGDIRAMGESVWRLQHMGSKIAEIEHHRNFGDIYETLELMKKKGSYISGMSSVGPAITALLPNGEEVAELLKEKGFRVILTHPDNGGLKTTFHH